ncbi:MAG TPA: hypothetical protein VFT46_02765, partial [Holophagaceae bacterium]|nr:hypothetical protein [Holophagaceae bacterium]
MNVAIAFFLAAAVILIVVLGIAALVGKRGQGADPLLASPKDEVAAKPAAKPSVAPVAAPEPEAPEAEAPTIDAPAVVVPPLEVVPPVAPPVPVEVERPSVAARLRRTLTKSRQAIGERLGAIVGRGKLDEEAWEDIEEALI